MNTPAERIAAMSEAFAIETARDELAHRLLDVVENPSEDLIQSIGERTGNLDHTVRGVLAALLENVK